MHIQHWHVCASLLVVVDATIVHGAAFVFPSPPLAASVNEADAVSPIASFVSSLTHVAFDAIIVSFDAPTPAVDGVPILDAAVHAVRRCGREMRFVGMDRKSLERTLF